MKLNSLNQGILSFKQILIKQPGHIPQKVLILHPNITVIFQHSDLIPLPSDDCLCVEVGRIFVPINNPFASRLLKPMNFLLPGNLIVLC